MLRRIRVYQPLPDGTRALLGIACEGRAFRFTPDSPEELIGWTFNPNIAGRKPSRAFHPTADACIPAWVRKRPGVVYEPQN